MRRLHRRTLRRRLRRLRRLGQRRLLGRGRGGRLAGEEVAPRDEPLQVLQLRLELLRLR